MFAVSRAGQQVNRGRSGLANELRLNRHITSAAALCSALCAAQPAAVSLDHATARTQRIQSAMQRNLAAYHARDIATCHAIGQEMLPDLQAEWSRDVFWLWSSLAYCDARPGGPWEDGVASSEPLFAAHQALLKHFAAMPREQRIQNDFYIGAHARFWDALRYKGHEVQADQLELQTIEDLIARATASPPDDLALAGLTMIGAELYGKRSRTVWMEQLQQQLATALGPGHVNTLLILRARIFAMRQLERPAQALALSDDYAALVQRHQGGNERLLMGNRSERVGAFAGVGRFADARDEGLALLHYLQRQQPRPYANLMRSAYNLAGLHINMADYDGAVEYAQMSIDEGMQTPSLIDRNEVALPKLLLAQARSLRGDPGASADLHAEIRSVLSHDLATTGPIHTLWQSTAHDGSAQVRAFARELLGRIVSENSSAMQATRAMPLVMDAAALPAGNAAGLQHAAQASAYALAGNDDSMQVLAQFALARQVAPLRPEGAAWVYKRAALALLQLRKGLPDTASVTQQAMLAGHEADLRAYIGLLIDSGRLAEAEQAIEVLREEELHEFRRRSRGALVRASAVRGLSYTSEESRRNALLAPVQQSLQAEATQAQQRADRHSLWKDRLAAADPQAEAALAAGAQALQALATAPAPLGSATEQEPGATARLGTAQARLAFLVRADTVDVVLQRGATRQRFSVPVPATQLNRTVQALRAELVKPGSQVPAAAQQLHQWLIAPLAAHLHGIKHLHLAPDGALRYVPFAALHDGRHYLAQRFSVSMELGVSASAVAPRTRAGAIKLAAFGRTLPDAQHSALPGVRDELAALQGLRGATVQQGLDAAFTASTLARALAQQPSVVHLASHFVLDAAGEENSYLLLGDGSRMPLRELRQLPWQGVRVALLSACDSGLAPQAAYASATPATPGSGKEWAGFAGALHAAGVPSVVATLWRIDDAAAAQWMQQLYAPWRQVRGAAAAMTASHLAQTQRHWLRKHQGTALAHPYYWAAFQWMGAPG